MKHKKILLVFLFFIFLFSGFSFRDKEEKKTFFGFDTWIEVELPQDSALLFPVSYTHLDVYKRQMK